MEINNIKAYNKKIIVDHYKNSKGLTQIEQIIFDQIKDQITDKNILDIGIGGGRTTDYLAPIAKQYIGIDYAEEMVQTCRAKYKDLKNSVFEWGDARNLRKYNNNTFDFIFFSFNGIDSVNESDRNLILSEIYRVAKEKSIFLFSSHNINNIPSLYRYQFGKNFFKWPNEILRVHKLKTINKLPTELLDKEICRINDGAHNFNLELCYVNPLKQIEVLHKIGYRNIQAFDFKKRIETAKDIETTIDPWVHYLCFKGEK